MFDYREIRSFELADDVVTLVSRMQRVHAKRDEYNVLPNLKQQSIEFSMTIAETTSLSNRPKKVVMYESALRALSEIRYGVSKARALSLCGEPEFFNIYKILGEQERTLFSLIASSSKKKLLAAQG